MNSTNIVKDSKRRVFVSMFIMTALIGIIGTLLSTFFHWGLTGTGYFLIAAGLINFIAYFFSDKLVVKLSKAKPLAYEMCPEFYDIINKLCERNNLKMPKLYIIEDNSINAFATGRDINHAVLAITIGALEKLSPEEVSGVAAHELAHIESNDVRLMAVLSVFAGIISIIADLFWYSSVSQKMQERDQSGACAIIGLALSVFAPITVMLLKLFVSRQKEFAADARGAEICGNPNYLADALYKIKNDMIPLAHASSATAHLYISEPNKYESDFIENLMSTHPNINERIDKLRNLNIGKN